MILLDTSFLVSNYNKRENNNLKASTTMKDILEDKYGEPAITDYIFDETATVILSRTGDIKRTIAVLNEIKNLKIIPMSKDIFDDTLEIFKQQINTFLSFTDCSNLAIMRKYNINYLATFDKGFNKIDNLSVIP